MLSDNLMYYIIGILLLLVLVIAIIQFKKFRKFLIGLLTLYLMAIIPAICQEIRELPTLEDKIDNGVGHLQNGEFGDAEKIFKAITKDAESDSIRAYAYSLLSSAYTLHAMTFNETGESDSADYYFELALATSDIMLGIRRDLVDTWLSRCALLWEMDRLERARACCDSVLLRDPNNSKAKMLRDSIDDITGGPGL